MLSFDSIIAIVAAMLGSGGLFGFVNWLGQHFSRDRRVTKADIDKIEAKLDRDYRHMSDIDDKISKIDGDLHDFRITQLRQCLFARPHDQNSHRSCLESGDEYLAKGGNGVGHIRLQQLQEEWRIRDETNDWDYSHHINLHDDK